MDREKDKKDFSEEAEQILDRIKACCLEEEYGRGTVLFWENLGLLREYGGIDYVLLCNAMAVVLEKSDREEAVWFGDEAWRGLKEFGAFLTKKKVWEIRYVHDIFHFLYRKESDYEKELLGLYEEIVRNVENPDEEIGILLIKILFYILSAHAGQPEMKQYFEEAQEFYRLAGRYEYEKDMQERSILNRRSGAYYLALVYLSQGNIMPAEQYLKETVSLSEEFPNTVLDFYGLQKLAMVYFMQNDFVQAAQMAELILPLLDEEDCVKGITQRELQLGTILLSNIFAAVGENELAADVVREGLEEGILYPEPGDKYITFVYDEAVYRTIAYHNGLPEEYEESFVGYMKEIEYSDVFVKLSDMELAEHYAVKALLYWHLGDCSVLHTLESRFAGYTKHIFSWEEESFYFPCLLIIAMNMKMGKTDTAVSFTKRAVKWNEKRLAKALVYQNRKRLGNFCIGRNKIFYAAYSVYRSAGKMGACHSLLLNYKNMESLITVFRNRITDELDEMKELTDEINRLLDMQTMIQMNERLGQEDLRKEEITKELEEKEYLFSKKMSGDYEFQPFCTQDVLEKMPDDSAYVEYLFYIKDFYLSMLDAKYHEEAETRLDVFCFVKKGGRVEKKCFSVTDLHVFLEEMQYYLREMEKRYHKKIEKCRHTLYHYLISHIEGELKGIKTLYIAPDGELCNLPFHVLTDERGVMLGDKCHVVMIDTGRDFLRKSPESFASHLMVVGNPAYDYKNPGRIQGYAGGRKNFRESPIESLPFSELEAKVVGRELKTKPYFGRAAARQVAEAMPLCRWIHLATHGVHDSEAFGDGWYSSALLFAGAENWRRTGIEDETYGNGIITADEISRMKLGHTEMVVLSACYGGRVDSDDMAGICQGFRAAGVKYMVSALWEVDDIAALIFMEEFYKNLRVQNILEAMETARRRLCSITLSEAEQFLKNCMSEYSLENRDDIAEGLKVVDEMRKIYKENYRIYADPYYWSGFVCYQNTF